MCCEDILYVCLVPTEAPDILFKSHYESPSNDDSGSTATGSRRKTRNSNGSRGVASRAGLRSQKIANKNDSDEEGVLVYRKPREVSLVR